MSNRLKFLTAIKDEGKTIDQLVDVVEWSRKKIADTANDLRNVKMLTRDRDDVTGQPLYTITQAGLDFLAREKTSVPQAGSGENPGSKPSESIVDAGPRAVPPTEGLADEGQPEPEATAPVEPTVIKEPAKVIPPPQYDPDAVCFDPVKRAQALEREISAKDTELAGWRLFGRELTEATGIASVNGILDLVRKLHAGEGAKQDPVAPRTAPEFLESAANIMRQRAHQYDEPSGERSMDKTVSVFNTITDHRISEAEGWLLLQILKDVRQWKRHGYHRDSAEDCVAYAALKAEALAAEA